MIRFDTLTIHDGKLTPECYFVGRAIVTGGPIVLDYTQSHGVHIFRPESEVFDQASMDSLKLIPLTDGHPPANLNAETVRQHAIGFTGEQVERVGNNLAVNFKITDQKYAKATAEAQAKKKRVEFSIGANAERNDTPGTFNDQAYQVSMAKIRYNHLALLLDSPGRYPNTRLIDSQEEFFFVMDGALKVTNLEEPKTVKIKLLNGREIEVSDAEAPYLENEIADHKEAKEQAATLTGQNQSLTRQVEQQQSQIMDAAAVNTLVATRLKLAAEVQPLLKDKTIAELAAMDSASIQEAVLIADGLTADELAAQKTAFGDAYPAYLAGAYSTALKNKGKETSQNILKGVQHPNFTPQDSALVIKDASDVYQKLQARMDAQRKGVKA